MQPPTAPQKRGVLERATLVALVGLSVLSVLGVATVTVYLNRLSESTADLPRARIMSDYAGRPESVIGSNGNPSVNYLIMASSADGLDAVVVANLSSSRRSLTLITVPADVLATSVGTQTVAAGFALDPAITVRTMEGLTDARMDHQILIDLDQFAAVIDAIGGISIGDTQLTGAQAVALVTQAPDSQTAAVNCGSVIRASLVTADDYSNLVNPSKLNHMIDTLGQSVILDSTLTNQVIRNTVVDSSVHPVETQVWPVKTEPSAKGTLPEEAALTSLRSALDSPNLADTQQYQQTAFIPQETHR